MLELDADLGPLLLRQSSAPWPRTGRPLLKSHSLQQTLPGMVVPLAFAQLQPLVQLELGLSKQLASGVVQSLARSFTQRWGESNPETG